MSKINFQKCKIAKTLKVIFTQTFNGNGDTKAGEEHTYGAVTQLGPKSLSNCINYFSQQAIMIIISPNLQLPLCRKNIQWCVHTLTLVKYCASNKRIIAWLSIDLPPTAPSMESNTTSTD